MVGIIIRTEKEPTFSLLFALFSLTNLQVNDVESLKKLPVQDEEEEKEQSSPVSVLDPPFQDDEEGRYEDGEDNDDYEMERSYAIVESKHDSIQLLIILGKYILVLSVALIRVCCSIVIGDICV